MSPTGSKLVKIAEVFGFDLYEDVELNQLVLDLGHTFEVVSSFDAALKAAKIELLYED